MDKEILHKEIDLIQGVITRMANNSFLLKGWLVSLIAVVLALSKDTFLTSNAFVFCIILCFPVIAFWYLDAFFLHREKCYRKLYEWVITNRPSSNEYLYSLDFTRFKKDVNNIFKIMFSQTLLPFYGLVLLLLIVLMFILK
jgi:hypothetical protein